MNPRYVLVTDPTDRETNPWTLPTYFFHDLGMALECQRHLAMDGVRSSLHDL